MNAHSLGKALLSLPKTAEIGLPESNKIKLCLVSLPVKGKPIQIVIVDKKNDDFINEVKIKE